MHDAFISYSRKDAVFARALEKALERYRPPKELGGAPQRYLEVFRDEGDMTGVEYTASIERHLADSSKLIIICSPHARASTYVNDEIGRFVRLRGAQHVVPVLAAGIPDNEARPEQDSERAFPKALCEALAMPLAVSFRGFDMQRDRVDRGAFSDAWFGLLANLYGVSRAEIEQREIRRRARQRRVTAGIVTGVIGSLAAALVVSLFFWKQAVEQRNVAELQSRIALSRQLAANSSQYATADPPLAMLLARESFATYRSPEARRALFSALHLVAPFTLETVKDEVTSAVFSPDGSRLAAAFDDSLIRVYDVHTLQLVGAPWKGHTGSVNQIAFNPDGRTLASVGDDKSLIVWDAAQGVPLRRSAPAVEGLVSVAFSPDGKLIATGGIDRHVLIWDPETLAVLRDLPGHKFAVNAIAFSPREPLLAATSGGEIQLWNPLTGEPARAALAGHDDLVWGLLFTPDRDELLSGGQDATIRFWDLRDGAPKGPPLVSHAGNVKGLALRPDGIILASGAALGITLWDVARRREISALPAVHTHWVNSLVFDPSATHLASAGGEGRLVLWSMNTLGTRFKLPLQFATEFGDDVILDRYGSHVVLATRNEKLQVWNLAASQAKPIEGLPGSGRSVLGVSRDGRLMALEQPDALAIWSVAEKRLLCRLPRDSRDSYLSASSVVFSPDSEKVAMSLPDNVYGLWRVKDCARVALPEVKHDSPVLDVRFSPDGTTIASNSQSDLRLQDIASGTERTLDSDYRIGEFAFSPDSRVIVAQGGEDMRLYDVQSGKPTGAVLAGQRTARDLAFAPDGLTLASVGDDGKIVLWDVPTASLLGPPIETDQGQLRQVVFTPDGKRLLTTGTDTGARMWDLDPDSWMRKACALAHRDLTAQEWQRFVGTSAARQKSSSCR
jgi:WD40 repeat protein